MRIIASSSSPAAKNRERHRQRSPIARQQRGAWGSASKAEAARSGSPRRRAMHASRDPYRARIRALCARGALSRAARGSRAIVAFRGSPPEIHTFSTIAIFQRPRAPPPGGASALGERAGGGGGWAGGSPSGSKRANGRKNSGESCCAKYPGSQQPRPRASRRTSGRAKGAYCWEKSAFFPLACRARGRGSSRWLNGWKSRDVRKGCRIETLEGLPNWISSTVGLYRC